MTNAPHPAEPALKDLVWSLLPAGDTPDSRVVSELLVFEIYSRGIIDSRKHPLDRWQGLFKEMPKSEAGYLIQKDKWPRIISFFFQGPIKKPFDPKKLRDGLRPLAWLNEVYQKVLRFETNLTLDDWKKIIAQHIQGKFIQKGQVVLRQPMRDLLAKLLEERSSSLRKLELWYHGSNVNFGPKPQEVPPVKKHEPVVIPDTFLAKPKETLNKVAIDKLYYHHEQHPGTDDKESLDFLDELAKLGDEEAEIK